MRPTYQDLLNSLLEIQRTNPERLTDNLAVYDAEEDETYSVNEITTAPNDCLDDGHLYFVIKELQS